LAHATLHVHDIILEKSISFVIFRAPLALQLWWFRVFLIYLLKIHTPIFDLLDAMLWQTIGYSLAGMLIMWVVVKEGYVVEGSFYPNGCALCLCLFKFFSMVASAYDNKALNGYYLYFHNY
jgi:hypothetical protein